MKYSFIILSSNFFLTNYKPLHLSRNPNMHMLYNGCLISPKFKSVLRTDLLEILFNKNSNFQDIHLYKIWIKNNYLTYS